MNYRTRRRARRPQSNTAAIVALALTAAFAAIALGHLMGAFDAVEIADLIVDEIPARIAEDIEEATESCDCHHCVMLSEIRLCEVESSSLDWCALCDYCTETMTNSQSLRADFRREILRRRTIAYLQKMTIEAKERTRFLKEMRKRSDERLRNLPKGRR